MPQIWCRFVIAHPMARLTIHRSRTHSPTSVEVSQFSQFDVAISWFWAYCTQFRKWYTWEVTVDNELFFFSSVSNSPSRITARICCNGTSLRNLRSIGTAWVQHSSGSKGLCTSAPIGCDHHIISLAKFVGHDKIHKVNIWSWIRFQTVATFATTFPIGSVSPKKKWHCDTSKGPFSE